MPTTTSRTLPAVPAAQAILDACLWAQRFFQRANGQLRVVWQETDAGMAMYLDGAYHTTLTWEELDTPQPP